MIKWDARSLDHSLNAKLHYRHTPSLLHTISKQKPSVLARRTSPFPESWQGPFLGPTISQASKQPKKTCYPKGRMFMSCYLGSERGSQRTIWVLVPSVSITNPLGVSGSLGNSQGEILHTQHSRCPQVMRIINQTLNRPGT